MVIYKSDALEISLPVGNYWIRVECASRPDFSTFKAGLHKALDFVKVNHTNCWLFDVRAIDMLGEEEETWLQVQFFPQLMMLGHENYFAVVVSEKCYDRLLQEVGAYGLRSYNSFIIIDTFCHLDEAENWLRSHLTNKVS